MDASEILKAVAIVSGAVGGIYGTLFDFKKDGRITKHGRRAIAGVVIATLVALSIHVEDMRANQAARKRLESDTLRQKTILLNTARAESTLALTLGRIQIVKSAVDSSAVAAESALALALVRIQNVRSAVDLSADAAERSLSSATHRIEEVHRAVDLSATNLLRASVAQDTVIRRTQLEILREYYPIDGAIVRYRFEYSMNDPAFDAYTRRIRQHFAGRDFAPGRRPVLSNKDSGLRPGDGSGEEDARQELLYDETLFTFKRPDGRELTLYCAPNPTAHFFAPSTGASPEVRISVMLAADFNTNTFVKDVECLRPFRIGTDPTAVSTIDLVGRTLSWGHMNLNHPKRTLMELGFVFVYEFDEPSRRRFPIPEGAIDMIVTTAMVGLPSDVGDLLVTK